MSYVDRRSHDPFAPPPPVVRKPSAPAADASSDSDGLDDLKRAELIAIAEDAGLPAYGTKAELVARIREAQAG